MKWIGLAYEKNVVLSNLDYLIVIFLFASDRVVCMGWACAVTSVSLYIGVTAN